MKKEWVVPLSHLDWTFMQMLLAIRDHETPITVEGLEAAGRGPLNNNRAEGWVLPTGISTVGNQLGLMEFAHLVRFAEEGGIRRYRLTQKGEAELERLISRHEEPKGSPASVQAVDPVP